MTHGCSRYVILCLAAYCNAAFSLETHCDDKTQVVFNCRLENSKKVVSVCKVGEGPDQQYLQYTFGEMGKAELNFPKKDRIQLGEFSFDRQYSRFAGYLEYNLTFIVGRNRYKIYSIESSKIDGVPKDEIDTLRGVSVLTSGGKSVDLRCNNDAIEDFMSAPTRLS
jgi:hypothetical protein